jgi:RHS repeat-associated protein
MKRILASIIVSILFLSEAVGVTFVTSTRVQAKANLNVRNSASTSGTILFEQSTGAMGLVLAGPTTSNGFVWYQVDWDNTTTNGWSADVNLQFAPPRPVFPGSSNSPGPLVTNLTPQFRWNRNPGVTNYEIYIRDVDSNVLVFPNAAGNPTLLISATNYSLPSGYLAPGRKYKWNGTSFWGTNEHIPPSGFNYGWFFVTDTLPTAPSHLEAVGLPGAIQIGWIDNSSNENGFRVERRVGPSAWSVIATRPANSTIYDDTSVTQAVFYTYRVRAFNGIGNSSYTSEVSTNSMPPPQPPSNLAVSGGSATIGLGWQDNSGNETGFKVERKTGATGTWAVIQTLGQNIVGATDNAVAAGLLYYYRIKAYNDVGDSLPSDEESASLSGTIPTISGLLPDGGEVLIAGTQTQIVWNVSGNTNGLSKFNVALSINGGTSFANLATALPYSQRSLNWSIPADLATTEGRVRVSVTDAAGNEAANRVSAANFTVTSGGNPTARIDASHSAAAPGQSVTFTGANSIRAASGATITSYSWNFGDGTSGSGLNVTHSFAGSSAGIALYPVQLTVTDANGQTDSETMVLLVTGLTLGTTPGTSFSLDPVNLATGNYIYEHVDLRIPGKGFAFEFKRFYNSKFSDESGRPLGYGWTHSYHIRLSATASNATVTFGDGHSETHTLTNSIYRAEPGVYDVLVQNPDSSFTLTSKNQFQHRFSSTGLLLAMMDKNSNTMTFGYEGATLTNITDTAGRSISFETNSLGLLSRMADPIGRLLQFGYDAQTNLITVTNAKGGVDVYTYDTNHQMTVAFDPRGTKYVENVYDELQRVVSSQRDAYTNKTGFSYDFVSRTTHVTNALGKVSIHRHDEHLLVTNIVDEAGYQQFFAYDTNRNRTLVRDKNANATLYGYDSRGNVTNKTDAYTNVTAIEYNARNNPIRRIDALTNLTTFGYDTNGNLTATTNAEGHVNLVTYDTNGLPVVLTDARTNSTTNAFDSQGNLIAIIDAKGFTNRFEYDGVGRKIQHIDPLNRTNSFGYDHNDNLLAATNALGLVTSYTYDLNNNRTSIRDPRGAITTNIFDLKDRLQIVTNALLFAITNEYDALDRVLTAIDARGKRTALTYDDVGNRIATTNALDKVTRLTFDPNGNLTSIIDPTGRFTTNFYDALDRIVVTIDAATNITGTAYDVLSRVVATTNALGQVTLFRYDRIGRLTNVVAAGTNSVSFAYDENGNRVHVTDPRGNTWTNRFDKLNRLIEQSDPRGNTTSFLYDPVGNITNKVTPNGASISYSYDALNRPTQITYPSGPPVLFTYDLVGNRTNMTDSLGTTTWTYDLLNRPLSITDPYGQTVTNGFDEVGNRIALGLPGSKTVHYGYDALNRLLAFTNWLAGVVSYGYDSRGNLITTTNANGTTAMYGYDVASRMVALTNARPDSSIIASYALVLDGIGNHVQSPQAQPLFPRLSNQTNTYAYDADNQLTMVDGKTVGHDNSGNLTNIGTETFGYDFENRLVLFSLTNLNGANTYDGTGNRLAYSTNSLTRHFILDRLAPLTQVLAETDTNGVVLAYYVHGLGLAQRITPDGAVSTYHFDIRGSTVAMTDSAGVVTDGYAYDSFGVLANEDTDSPQSFRYLGRYGIMQDSSGLCFARARFFSPQLGRFLTKDPLTGRDNDSQSFNRYVYALNNPLRFADPSGLTAREGNFNPYAAEAAYWAAYNESASWMAPYLRVLEAAGIAASVALDIAPLLLELRAATFTYLAVRGPSVIQAEQQVVTKLSSVRGWRVGDPINNLTANGNEPSWTAVRQRYWKNEAFSNPSSFDEQNLMRMSQGLAPQRLNPITGKIESMELHHDPPQRDGGLFDFEKVWPSQHSLIDPFRQLGN